MGCQIVSIYEDQVLGKMGYPQQAMQDLIARDIQQPNRNKELGQEIIINHKKVKSIYGFNQSFTASNFQSVVIKQRQFLMFNSLCYIVMLDIISRQQYLLSHQEQIVCFQINGKYLGTACLGGKITLWDLQQKQIRLEITLPKRKGEQINQNDNKQISRNCSAIAVTKKLIIVSDTCQPSNNVYAFDIQTGKLLGSSIIMSIEPTFRGIGFGEYHLVTIGADGVWFSKYSILDNEFIITKGMFNRFPRTSMACIAKVGTEYIITGGVDGYIFIWSNSYQCKVVYRIFDFPIMSLIINNKNIIVSNIDNKTKCLSYKLLKHFKEDDKDQPPTIQLQFTVIANYETLSPVQNLAFARLNSDLCYLQTRNGQLFSRIVPSSQVHQIRKIPIKQQVYSFFFLNTFKNNHNFRKSIVIFHEQTLQQSQKTISSHENQLFLWTVSYFKQKKSRKNVFHFVKLSVNQIQRFDKENVSYYKHLQVQLHASYSIKRKILKNSPYGFSPFLQHICHVSKNRDQNCVQKNQKEKHQAQQQQQQQDLLQAEIPKIIVFQCQQPLITDQLMNQQKKQFIIESQNFTKHKVDSINYVRFVQNNRIGGSKILLLVQQNNKIIIFSASKAGYKQLKVVQELQKYKENNGQIKEGIQVYSQKDKCQLTWNYILKQWELTHLKKYQQKQRQFQAQVAHLDWKNIQCMHKGSIQAYFISKKMGLFTAANGKIIQWNQK